jgi:hypothetical protein
VKVKRVFIFVIIGLALFGCAKKVIEEERIIKVEKREKISSEVWKIPIKLKDKEYKNIKTRVITNEKDFKEFIDKLKHKKGWKNRKNFLDILNNLKIDFENENFLFYSFKEDSAYIISAINPPIQDDLNITIKIDKELASAHLKGKFNYYALAYKVKKRIKNIIFLNDKNRKVIKNSN